MTDTELDPQRDLVFERVIRAPRSAIWRAWTDPEQLAQWWLPAPIVARIERLEPRAGGAFVTSMSDDGEAFVPHMDAVFLEASQDERIVFTNAIDSAWRPASPEPVTITAEITLTDVPEGTRYRAVVRHADPGARASHETLGFFEGWGTVAAGLAALVEADAEDPR